MHHSNEASGQAIGRSKAPWWRRAETLAAALAVACYVNMLPNDFCNDGHPIVRENRKVNAPGQWSAIWTTDYWSEAVYDHPSRDLLYRPVALASYRAVRMLFGIHPLPHHVVNLTLYAALCALVARLARRLSQREVTAVLAGCLFAVLPIHTEVLNNIVGRADLLAAAGMVVTILAHCRGMRAKTPGSSLCWRAVAAITAFLAMGSKESAIGLVAVVPLFDALWRRSIPEQRRGERWLSVKTFGRLAYLMAPAGLYLTLRFYALGGALHQEPRITKTINVLADAPLWQHALGVVQLWGMYWVKTLWPQILCVNYSINAIRLATDTLDPLVIAGVVAAGVLLGGAVLAWRRGRKDVAVLVAALVISYAPTSNALVLMQVFFAERIWFVPSIWAAMLLGMMFTLLTKRPVGTVVCVLLLGGMLARCWMRNPEWRHDGVLYAAAYHDLPNAVGVQYLYGQWLAHHGRFDEGEALLRRALEIDPGFTDAYRALGTAQLREGRVRDAVQNLQIASLQVPGHPPTEAALDRASRMLASRDDTLAELRERATSAPDDLDAHLALVRRLRDVGAIDEALAALADARDRFAERVAWLVEYAVTLQFADRRDEAIAVYRQCATREPDNPQLALELASLLLERREGADLQNAERWLEHAARFAPDAPMVLFLTAELAALDGRLDEALALYDRAIQGLPRGSPQRGMIEARATALGRRP